ncbi:MAG: hypothetical protein ACI31G_02325 [Bacilli bacterium]
MISDVVLSGEILEKTDSAFRYIKSSQKRLSDGKELEYKIPLMYWSRDKSNLLTSIKEGTKVLIQGRIESDDEIGLYILVNILQIV